MFWLHASTVAHNTLPISSISTTFCRFLAGLGTSPPRPTNAHDPTFPETTNETSNPQPAVPNQSVTFPIFPTLLLYACCEGLNTDFLTANEGDAREYGEEDTPEFFTDETRVADLAVALGFDATMAPYTDDALGRLKVRLVQHGWNSRQNRIYRPYVAIFISKGFDEVAPPAHDRCVC